MLLLLTCTGLLLVAQTSQSYPTKGRCIAVPKFCSNWTSQGYLLMRLPNAFNNYQLNETVEAIRDWQQLVGRCHAGLELFLCTIYAPICLNDKESGKPEFIKPCRSFCSTIRTSCEPVMIQHKYEWPTHSAFNCSKYVDDSMCVREDFVASTLTEESSVAPSTSAAVPGNAVCDLPESVLHAEVCSSDFVLKAEVTNIRDAKGQGSDTVLKIRRNRKTSGRTGPQNSRKTKKTSESIERVLVPENGCPNLKSVVKTEHSYLIILNKRSLKKKTKYIVKAIVPWKRTYKKLVRRSHCR